MIAYLKFAPYVVIALLLAGLLWYRAEYIKADDAKAAVESQLKLALDTNKEQAATIIRQKAESIRADLAAADLTKQLDDLRFTNSTQAQLIEDLGKTDAKVKSFNAVTVPNSLRRLLNKTKHVR